MKELLKTRQKVFYCRSALIDQMNEALLMQFYSKLISEYDIEDHSIYSGYQNAFAKREPMGEAY